MIRYKTAREYLGQVVVWEKTDSTAKYKEAIMGVLLSVEETMVAGEKVTYLHIKRIGADNVCDWNAKESRVVKGQALDEDVEDEDDDE